MNTHTEQNGDMAKTRTNPVYEACIDELIAGVDTDNIYTSLDGEKLNEYILLGRLMQRAGVAWVCLDHKCRCINPHRDLACVNCGRRRAKRRDVAKAEL